MPKRNQDDQKRDRKIDKKNGAPGDVLDQPATHHGADSGSDCAKARPGPDGATAFILRKRTTDDGETAGNEERRAESLKRPGSDQLADVPSKSARGRRRGEQRNADQKNAATAVVIAKRTADEQQRGEQKRVGFDHPLQVNGGGVEARLQRRQRDVDDGAVDEGHAGSENGGCEHPASARFRTRRGGGARPDYVLVTRFSE